MRILIATGLYPPDIGGPATYAKLFEERLPSYGIEVSVLPFSTVRYLPPVLRHIVYGWNVVRLARNVDGILVQDTVSTGLPTTLASVISRRPLILRVPGDYAWEQGVQRFGVAENLDEFQKRSYGPAVRVLRAIQRFVVRRAVRVIAPSQYLARIIAEWIPDRKKIDVIYNGIDLVQVRLAQEQHEPKRDVNLIVSSGRLVPWKGFVGLIDIVARHPEWRLEIIGDGPQHTELLERVRNIGAGERIILHGRVPHAEVRDMFARASVFVLNSTYEGLSHTLIEAMSVGTPAITTRVGGNPEVIQDGVNGILVEPGDTTGLEKALARLLSDEELRRKLGTAAAERAKDFSIDKTIEATASLLRACVS